MEAIDSTDPLHYASRLSPKGSITWKSPTSLPLEVVREFECLLHPLREAVVAVAKKHASGVLNACTGLDEDDPPWLWQLRLEGRIRRDSLFEKHIKEVGELLANRSPARLYSKFVAAISEPPISDDESKYRYGAFKDWLILHWVAPLGAPLQFSLCLYNFSALARVAEVFLAELGKRPRKPEDLRQVSRRLGLPRLRRLLFRDVRKTEPKWSEPRPDARRTLLGGKVVAVPYKKYWVRKPTSLTSP